MTNSSKKLVSNEINPRNCSIAKAIIDHARLLLKMKVIEETLDGKLEELDEVPHFESIFMDHSK